MHEQPTCVLFFLGLEDADGQGGTSRPRLATVRHSGHVISQSRYVAASQSSALSSKMSIRSSVMDFPGSDLPSFVGEKRGCFLEEEGLNVARRLFFG